MAGSICFSPRQFANGLVFGTDTSQGDWLKSQAEAASDDLADLTEETEYRAENQKEGSSDKDSVLVKVPSDEAYIKRDEIAVDGLQEFL